MRSGKFSLWYWAGFALVLVIWLGLAYLVVPRLIEDAYHGESLAFLNNLISGQDQHSLESYLQHWASVAERLTMFLLVGAVLAFGVVSFREPLVRLTRFLVFGSAETPAAWATILLLATALGLLAGFAEAAWVLAKNWHAPNWEDYTSSVAWMAPLGSAAVFVILAVAVLLVTWPYRRLRNLRVVGFIFSFLLVYAFARSLQVGVHPWAASILALGVGVKTAGYASRRPDVVRAVARRAFPLLASLLLVVAVGTHGYEWVLEKRAAAGLGDVPANARNVLLIILDTVRGQSLSIYGYERQTTPQLERWAADAVVFDRAIATSPWTLPTHASLFTGRFPHQFKADWETPMEEGFPTLAEYLGSLGYESAAFIGNYYYCGRRSGLNRGFVHYDDDPISLSAVASNSWLARTILYYFRQRSGNQQVLARRYAEEINGQFLSWLDGRGERPFFGFINYYDAHGPYLPPEPFNTAFHSPQPLYWEWPRREYTEEALQQLTAAYDGAILYTDAQLGRLMGELDERGILDSTLVIIVGDHGEQFAEARMGLVLHGNSLYMTNLQVPLLILDRRLESGGSRVAEGVSLRDLPATVVDLLGISSLHPFPGTSLRRYWSQGDTVDRAAYTGVLAEVTQPPYWTRFDPVRLGDMSSLLEGPYHYILNGDGSEELYDIISDPWERSDLSKLAASDSLLQRFRTVLQAMTADTSATIASH